MASYTLQPKSHNVSTLSGQKLSGFHHCSEIYTVERVPPALGLTHLISKHGTSCCFPFISHPLTDPLGLLHHLNALNGCNAAPCLTSISRSSFLPISDSCNARNANQCFQPNAALSNHALESRNIYIHIHTARNLRVRKRSLVLPRPLLDHVLNERFTGFIRASD